MNELDSFENLTTFAGLPVEPFAGTASLSKVATHAYRIGMTWDDENMEETFHARLDALLATPEIGSLQALVIGRWCESMEKFDPFMEKLLQNAGSLTSLRAIFIGDIAQEESEVSWIEQCDHGPLISALPQLEFYGVRGGNNLRFTGAKNASLRKLVVQTGGLPSTTIGDIIAANLPGLRHLELWLGEDNYGFDGSVDTLKPLIEGKAHPALSYLGLRNSEIADGIAAAFQGSTRFGTLSELDLSKGILTDEGGAALLSNPAIEKLERLDLHHHYMDEDVAEKFNALDVQVDVSDPQETEVDEDDGEIYRSVAVSE